MKPDVFVTTSWDDGHPYDLRVAEMLAKHGLRGTFYIPRNAERGTMGAQEVRELSASFEIGAHTVDHVVLTEADDPLAWREISESKMWVEDVVGAPCALFCPPKGRFAKRHLKMIRRARYLGVRTAELASLDFPRIANGLAIMPTTVQAYPHARSMDFVRNSLKRAAFRNLWRFVVHGRSGEWPTLARALLRRALKDGGVFHLWGHSWEIGEPRQWRRLDSAFALMAEIRGDAPAATNGQICGRAAVSAAPTICVNAPIAYSRLESGSYEGPGRS